MVSSTSPQARITTTSQAPTVAAAAAPAIAQHSHRAVWLRRCQLAPVRPAPAWTAGTAAPAPAPAPSTHSGGALPRNSAASARMTMRPGMMNAAPPKLDVRWRAAETDTADAAPFAEDGDQGYARWLASAQLASGR
jgi:hypothetical protein